MNNKVCANSSFPLPGIPDAYSGTSYHWNDRELYYTDSMQCYHSFHRLLPGFTAALNSALAVENTERYWKIAVGPWLLLCLEVFCDRLRTLELLPHSDDDVSDRAGVPEVDLINQISSDCSTALLPTPVSTNEFREWVAADNFNQTLLSSLSRIFAGDHRNTAKASSGIKTPSGGALTGPTLRARAKRAINKTLCLYTRFVPNRLTQFAFITSYFRTTDLVRLQLGLGQAPYPRAPELEVRPSPIQPEIREQFCSHLREWAKAQAGRRLFSLSESATLLLAGWLLPRTFLEDYPQALNLGARNLPRRPRVIIAGNAHISDDVAQIWIASHVQRGAKFLVVQHGGHYGTGRWSSTDEFEISISDRFLSWGWTQRNPECEALPGGNSNKVVPLDSPKLIGIGRRIRARPTGNLLLALNSVPRYAYRTYSVPVASQYLYYLNSVAEFCEQLPYNVRTQLLIRCHPKSWGWQDKELLAARIPEATVYRGSARLESQLNEARLFIATHNATTFLETLAANYPTLIFWNSWYYELNEVAQRCFDELKAVGIFHNSSKTAVAQVEAILADTPGWWNSFEVQAARQRFVNQYAFASSDWKNHWVQMLRSTAHTKMAVGT